MLAIVWFSVGELFKSWWLAGYSVLFMALGWAVFDFAADTSQAIASLLSPVLIIVPMVSGVVGILYFYNSRDYAEMLLSQPVSRRSAFAGYYFGLAISLAAAVTVGIVAPFIWFGALQGPQVETVTLVLCAAALLTLIFVGFAFLVAVMTENRVKALGVVLGLWMFFTLAYDGILLMFIVRFPFQQLSGVLLVLSMLNPVDLARVLCLFRLDIAALMGVTGAEFHRFFGSQAGMAVTLASLGLWALLPTVVAARIYQRRDF